MSFGYIEELESKDREMYLSKLKILNLKECPYKLPTELWIIDPATWPQFDWGELYTYLIDSPGIYTKESMRSFKSLEAYNWFKSGCVQTINSYRPPASSNIILRADVKPPQGENDQSQHPWAALTEDGTVITAHCDCIDGLAECCLHIAALLFKVEAAVRYGYAGTAFTAAEEEECEWENNFAEEVTPQPVAKINFYTENSVNRARNRTRRRHQPYAPSTPAEQEQLLQALSKCQSKPVALSCFKGYCEHWINKSKS